MKRNFVLLTLVIGLMLLFGIGITMAQDTTPEVGDIAPVATLEAEATLEAGDASVTVSNDGQTTTVTLPAPAAPAAPPAQDNGINWQTIFMSVLAAIIVVDRITGQGLQKVLATLIHPDKAKMLIETGIRIGLQIALNNAAKTPDAADDAEWIRQARDAGFTATLQPDGTYSLVRTNSAISEADLVSSFLAAPAG
jgi:hypothetical protein